MWWIQVLAQEENSSIDWNSFFRPEVGVPIAGCLVGAIAIVAVIWSKTVMSNRTTELKRSMVERGMSAEEIERVISAKDESAS